MSTLWRKKDGGERGRRDDGRPSPVSAVSWFRGLGAQVRGLRRFRWCSSIRT
ncbi:hypothetical protein LY76DRAFT_349713 [Colletotrichum caudatum]|nr:hypothetical protein LY76DRAFT_349713 [Colletotrichum caudatum]